LKEWAHTYGAAIRQKTVRQANHDDYDGKSGGKSWNSTSLLVPKRPGKKMLFRERQLILQMT